MNADERLTFLELAEVVLNDAKVTMSPEEIWQYALDNGYDQRVESRGATPWRSIGARIYVDIRDNPDTPFVKAGTRPRRFYLKSLSDAGVDLIDKVERSVKQPRLRERDIHPFVAYFASVHLNSYVKTIYHERSRKGSFNEWLHPDLVGCDFPIGEWEAETLDLGKSLGSSLIRLYSFELKVRLDFSNLREAFFQCVSNSSWAHEGYLVVSDMLQDDEFLQELKRLSAAFGIGVIKLDLSDPDSSEIALPAASKSELDWDTVNKLARENPDFREFLRRVKNDLNSREVRKEEYDSVLSVEELARLAT